MSVYGSSAGKPRRLNVQIMIKYILVSPPHQGFPMLLQTTGMAGAGHRLGGQHPDRSVLIASEVGAVIPWQPARPFVV